MDNGSAVALSGQMARERQMDVLANNIANLSTTAFKGESMIFAELLAGGPGGSTVAYVQDVGTVTDWSQGPLTQTGNSLDVALQGAGFLEVQTAAGVRYTRDGRLKLDSQGDLITLDGDAVLDGSQQPIVVPAGSGPIAIGQDGTLTTRGATVAKLGVVSFDDLQSLTAEASGRYNTDQIPNPVPDTKVMQGMLEESNVQPILEMTRLMQASRSIGAAKTFQDGEADRRKNAIDRLAKVV